MRPRVRPKKIIFNVLTAFISPDKEVYGEEIYNENPITINIPPSSTKEAMLGFLRVAYTQKFGSEFIKHPFEETKTIRLIKKLVIIKEL